MKPLLAALAKLVTVVTRETVRECNGRLRRRYVAARLADEVFREIDAELDRWWSVP